MMIPFIPYGGLTYKSTTFSMAANKGTAIDLTVGSAIAWSQQGAVFVEYTQQQITRTSFRLWQRPDRVGCRLPA